VVLLDRDGTVTRECGLVNHPARLRLEPSAAAAISLLNGAGIPVVLVTNQPGVGRGLVTEEVLEATQARLVAELAARGARLDGAYACPHAPGDGEPGCACHKPRPGLGARALEDLGAPRARLFVVGDRATDLELAATLGARGILVLTGYGRGEWEHRRATFSTPPDHVASDLEEAVAWILPRAGLPDDGLVWPLSAWPHVTEELEDAVVGQLHEGLSVPGAEGVVADLERAWATETGRRHAVAVSSGTMALFALYRALGIGPGDEVVVPAYGFFATASPLLALGARPVFADVDATGNLCPEAAEAAVSPATRALVASHIWGVPADLEALGDVCRRAGVPLLEDASHAPGAERGGVRAGSAGHAAVFSLQANKLCPAGEGGVVVTDDTELARRLVLMGHYGARNRAELPAGHPLEPYAMTGAGLKLRLPPLAAAVGLASLRGLGGVRAGRRRCATAILERLRGCPELAVAWDVEGVRPSYHVLPLLLGGRLAGCRERFREAVAARGRLRLFSGQGTGSLPGLPLFSEPQALHPGHAGAVVAGAETPVADGFARRVVLVPLSHRLLDVERATSAADELLLAARACGDPGADDGPR